MIARKPAASLFVLAALGVASAAYAQKFNAPVLRRPGLAPTAKPAPAPAPTPTLHVAPGAAPTVTTVGLRGWVDLHAHPMSNLGFGTKLIHGGPDVGSLLPVDAQCHHNVRATSMEQALGDDRGTHSGWGAFDNPCGDSIRQAVIDALQEQNHAYKTPDHAHGAPDFRDWPRWDDITHQKMWFEWVRHARDGGQRVMVALATSNATLAAATAGPGDHPTDDKASADLQLDEIKAMVRRHPDFMEIALTPADVHRIASANKIAVVLGVEIDNIGNFNKVANVTEAMVSAEIARLYAKGVRYVFPIHVIDNKFGGTAVYSGAFNTSNYREAGHFWDLECAPAGDYVTYKFANDGFDAAVAAVKATKLHIDVARNPPTPPNCCTPRAGMPPLCTGHRNKQGLTPLGEFAVRDMMRRGMMVDIDHMSEHTVDRVLHIAETVPGGYPLFSGHNGIRGSMGPSENQRTGQQLQRLADLHGMFGLGSADLNARQWLGHYDEAILLMRGKEKPGMISFGTDLNGLVKGSPPRAGSAVRNDAALPVLRTGSKTWDYNRDGVAHYGMLAEFVRDVRTMGNGADVVDNHLMKSAEYFYETWQRCEAQKSHVPAR